MPLTHSPQGHRQDQPTTSEPNNPVAATSHITEDISGDTILRLENLSVLRSENPPPSDAASLEQVTLLVSRSMEEMQRQIHAIFSAVKVNNVSNT